MSDQNKQNFGKRKCEYCHKALSKVGTARSNGVLHHGDWADRALHKKCYKEVEANRLARGMIERLLKR